MDYTQPAVILRYEGKIGPTKKQIENHTPSNQWEDKGNALTAMTIYQPIFDDDGNLTEEYHEITYRFSQPARLVGGKIVWADEANPGEVTRSESDQKNRYNDDEKDHKKKYPENDYTRDGHEPKGVLNRDPFAFTDKKEDEAISLSTLESASSEMSGDSKYNDGYNIYHDQRRAVYTPPPIDQATKKPTPDPGSQKIIINAETGKPLTDPATQEPLTDPNVKHYLYKPGTNEPKLNPLTKEHLFDHVVIDPSTQTLLRDPETNKIKYGPSGAPLIDPSSGKPFKNPNTGTPLLTEGTASMKLSWEGESFVYQQGTDHDYPAPRSAHKKHGEHEVTYSEFPTYLPPKHKKHDNYLHVSGAVGYQPNSIAIGFDNDFDPYQAAVLKDIMLKELKKHNVNVTDITMTGSQIFYSSDKKESREVAYGIITRLTYYQQDEFDKQVEEYKRKGGKEERLDQIPQNYFDLIEYMRATDEKAEKIKRKDANKAIEGVRDALTDRSIPIELDKYTPKPSPGQKPTSAVGPAGKVDYSFIAKTDFKWMDNDDADNFLNVAGVISYSENSSTIVLGNKFNSDQMAVIKELALKKMSDHHLEPAALSMVGSQLYYTTPPHNNINLIKKELMDALSDVTEEDFKDLVAKHKAKNIKDKPDDRPPQDYLDFIAQVKSANDPNKEKGTEAQVKSFREFEDDLAKMGAETNPDKYSRTAPASKSGASIAQPVAKPVVVAEPDIHEPDMPPLKPGELPHLVPPTFAAAQHVRLLKMKAIPLHDVLPLGQALHMDTPPSHTSPPQKAGIIKLLAPESHDNDLTLNMRVSFDGIPNNLSRKAFFEMLKENVKKAGFEIKNLEANMSGDNKFTTTYKMELQPDHTIANPPTALTPAKQQELLANLEKETKDDFNKRLAHAHHNPLAGVSLADAHSRNNANGIVPPDGGPGKSK